MVSNITVNGMIASFVICKTIISKLQLYYFETEKISCIFLVLWLSIL